jgi:hypothetical protein
MAFLFNENIVPLTLDNLEITDLYHISNVTAPTTILKDLVYPMSRGRRAMLIGAEHDDASSLTVHFDDVPPEFHNKLYADSYENLWLLIEEITTLLYDKSSMCTLKCYLFPSGSQQENMRITFHPTGTPRPLSIHGQMVIQQPFIMKAAKYRA